MCDCIIFFLPRGGLATAPDAVLKSCGETLVEVWGPQIGLDSQSMPLLDGTWGQQKE